MTTPIFEVRAPLLLSAALAFGCAAAGPVAELALGRPAPTAHAPEAMNRSVRVGGGVVDSEGLHIAGFSLGLFGIGRRELREVDHDAEPHVVGGEVHISRAAGVTEWWRAVPSGLEHGMTIEERPDGEGPLVLSISAGRDVSVHLEGGAVALRDPSGRELGRYGELRVADAAGTPVPAELLVLDDRIALRIHDAAARYPIVVDPLLTTAEGVLTGRPPPWVPTSRFGTSVALSADGTRALVGSVNDDSNRGAAYVFVWTGSAWDLESVLQASDGAAGNEFGSAVALSADGSRAVVGAHYDGWHVGSAYVFVRTGGSWRQEAMLAAPDPDYFSIDAEFGISVSMSADGSRAIVGAYGDDVFRGTVMVFARSGTTWAFEAALQASDGYRYEYFGYSVSLTADGTRALVGSHRHESFRGSAYVFTRSGTTWTEEAILNASDRMADDYFGISVAIAGDGSRAIVGGRNVRADRSVAYVFVRSGTAWREERRLTGSDIGNYDYFGSAVALSGDGALALVGAPGWGFDRGRGYVFTRAGASWTEAAHVEGAMTESLGHAVALSADASRALVSAPIGNDNHGLARVYRLTDACSTGSECPLGFCVDGVCCDGACGGGDPNDCMGCADALTGTGDGRCAPLAATVAATVTCRAAADACDVAEHCEPGDTSCPPDVVAPATTVCRPSVIMGCDPVESCDGVGVVCPPDVSSCADAGGTSGTIGSNCVRNEDCVSGICASDGARSYCTEVCTDACPAGFTCTPAGSVSICAPDSAAGGCQCSVGRTARPVFHVVVVLAFVAMLLQRRGARRTATGHR